MRMLQIIWIPVHDVWFQACATKWMGTALFWVLTQQVNLSVRNCHCLLHNNPEKCRSHNTWIIAAWSNVHWLVLFLWFWFMLLTHVSSLSLTAARLLLTDSNYIHRYVYETQLIHWLDLIDNCVSSGWTTTTWHLSSLTVTFIPSGEIVCLFHVAIAVCTALTMTLIQWANRGQQQGQFCVVLDLRVILDLRKFARDLWFPVLKTSTTFEGR